MSAHGQLESSSSVPGHLFAGNVVNLLASVRRKRHDGRCPTQSSDLHPLQNQLPSPHFDTDVYWQPMPN